MPTPHLNSRARRRVSFARRAWVRKIALGCIVFAAASTTTRSSEGTTRGPTLRRPALLERAVSRAVAVDHRGAAVLEGLRVPSPVQRARPVSAACPAARAVRQGRRVLRVSATLVREVAVAPAQARPALPARRAWAGVSLERRARQVEVAQRERESSGFAGSTGLAGTSGSGGQLETHLPI